MIPSTNQKAVLENHQLPIHIYIKCFTSLPIKLSQFIKREEINLFVLI